MKAAGFHESRCSSVYQLVPQRPDRVVVRQAENAEKVAQSQLLPVARLDPPLDDRRVAEFLLGLALDRDRHLSPAVGSARQDEEVSLGRGIASRQRDLVLRDPGYELEAAEVALRKCVLDARWKAVGSVPCVRK